MIESISISSVTCYYRYYYRPPVVAKVWLEAVLGTVDLQLRPTRWWCRQKSDMHLCWGLNNTFISFIFLRSFVTDTSVLLNQPIQVWMTKNFLSSGWMFSYQAIPLFRHSTICILFYFVHSLVWHRCTRSMRRYYWFLFLKAAGWDGVFIFFWSACDMHNSSVIWVETKVLWCCTIITTGPVFQFVNNVSILIGIANQISVCHWLTGWRRVSGGRQKLWSIIQQQLKW